MVKNANHDLALAVTGNVATTMDTLHNQVVAQRLKSSADFRPAGYALPIMFPSVGHLPWDSISDLRTDKHLADFRKVLRVVEEDF